MPIDLKCKRPLMLQGPMGPFFSRLGRELRQQGLTPEKINFNGGDVLYYPSGTAYTGSPADWPAFLESYLLDKNIDLLILYGDSRPIHLAAREVAKQLGIRVMVFEEGYIRPHFITIEEGGANYNSSIPAQLPLALAQAAEAGTTPPWESGRSIGAVFGRFAWYSVFYSIAIQLGRVPFRKYRHHKSLGLIYQSIVWVKSCYRRYACVFFERGQLRKYAQNESKNYFLVPLQVHNDFQVQNCEHGSVPRFIQYVMQSFAEHAPAGTHLVLKHHPMDRGEFHYQKLIDEEAQKRGIVGRVAYLHDQHLPTLLKNALGTVTINSTAGLSSLFHRTPTFCTSHSIYTCIAAKGSLEDFWKKPGAVNYDEVNAFRSWLRDSCQANGSFYRRTFRSSPTGMKWPLSFEGPAPSSQETHTQRPSSEAPVTGIAP